MVQSGVVLPEHLDLYDHGVAKKLDFAYSGPQSARIATMLFGGKIELGAVPGTALSHMASALFPDDRARAVEEFRTVSGLRTWLQRAMG